MKAAIYARKSTDDNDKNLDNKSVTRQVEHARAYAAKKGWTVADEHVFMDDGISGAEFNLNKRRGLAQLMVHLKEFDVVVMSDADRLGRDQHHTPMYRGKIIAAGKQIFYYLGDHEYKGTSPFDVLIGQLGDFTASMERIKASERSRDALTRKAMKGYSAGGAVYGYDLVPVYGPAKNGQQVRSHTDYRIHKAEAGVIVGIFRAYADGHGHTTIAKALNGNSSDLGPKGQRRRVLQADWEAVRKRYFRGRTPPSPQRGKRGTGSWAPSMIREVLYRERYTGKVPFGKRLKGKTQAEYILTDRPDLRIIDAELWERVQQRLKEVAAAYIRDAGHWWGRPAAEKYLLTGLGRCGRCSHNITMVGGYSGVPGKRARVFYYGCGYHHTLGHTVCQNDHRVRMETLNEAVLSAIEQQVLSPEAVAFTVEEAVRLVAEQRKRHPDRPRQIEAELKRLRRELARFVALIAKGQAPKTIREEIALREARIETLEREQREWQSAPVELDLGEIRRLTQARIGRFRELIYGDVPVARQALRKLLVEPLQFTPVLRDGRKGYAFKGTTQVGPLLDPTYKNLASPRGFEPRLPP